MAVLLKSRQDVRPGRRRVRVLPMPTVRAINPVRGMPFRWSFNPYRGCAHGCRYCYARVTHPYLGYNYGDDFDRVILAKVDAPEKLAAELARPSWGRELVAVGTATDPYQPVEGRLRLTAASLRIFARFRTPISLVTKSTLVVRDASLLAHLARVAPDTRVWFSVGCLDGALARSVEPGTPPPARRLAALARLRRAGVAAGVLVAPVLPGLSDDEESMAAAIRAAREAGAVDVRVSLLRLGPAVGDVYLAWLVRERPELIRTYQKLYGAGTHADLLYAERVTSTFERLRRQAGYEDRPKPEREEFSTAAAGGPVQLPLPW